MPIPQETPPFENDLQRDFLTRMFSSARLEDSRKNIFPIEADVPARPVANKIYFFARAISPDIKVAGWWGFDGANWIQISNNPEAVIAPSLGASWADVGTPDLVSGYYKHAGRVWLEGRITGGTSGSSPFTLPTGYRPSATVRIPIVSSTGGSPAEVVITSAGVVTINYSGSTPNISLDGVSFRV